LHLLELILTVNKRYAGFWAHASWVQVICNRRASNPRRFDLRIELPNGHACRTVSKVADLLHLPPRRAVLGPTFFLNGSGHGAGLNALQSSPRVAGSAAASATPGAATGTAAVGKAAVGKAAVGTTAAYATGAGAASALALLVDECTSGRGNCYCRSGRTRAIVR